MAVVGVTDHRWLGHRDGSLHLVPPQRGIEQVAYLIDEVRPDTIVTFGPDGMTGHTDHRTVSGWVTSAWTAMGRPSRLWYATLTPDFHREWGALNEEMGLWFEGSTPPSDFADELAYALGLDGVLLDRKFAALTAHRSQTGDLIAAVGPQRYRTWWSTEFFVDGGRKLDRREVA